jgi:hypothetical protein
MRLPPSDLPSPLLPAQALVALQTRGRAGVMVFVALVGLLWAAAFLAGFYPAVFHSDSAAHQVLAQAMVDEGRLLPMDFAYGNQLILWRNNVFIAPALLLGAQGYQAYAIGSAVNFTVLFLIAFLCIEAVFQDWRRSLLAAWLLFLPLGHSEADFVLGQQSHLAAVVLPLVIALCAYGAGNGDRRALVLGPCAVFLMVLEAPSRSAMMLLPLSIAMIACGRASASRGVGAAMLAAAVAGYAGNQWLAGSREVTGIPAVPLAAYDHFLSRAYQLLKGLVDFFIGFHQFDGVPANAGNLALYGFKTLALGASVALPLWLAVRLARRQTVDHHLPQPPVTAIEFLGVTGLMGALLGFVMVCAIEYWLDIRHFLWALVMLKLVLILWVIKTVPAGRLRWPALGVLTAVAILMSGPTLRMVLPAYRQQLKADFATHVKVPFAGRVQARMRELGTNRIYGEHWETLRLQVLVPGANASVLLINDSDVQFVSFLTRPSLKCVDGTVLYMLDVAGASQAELGRKIVAMGGRLLDRLEGHKELYAGPPAWNRSGCPR